MTLALGDAKIQFVLKPAEDLQLRVFLDGSIIEVFANDRLAALAPHRYARDNVGVVLIGEGAPVHVTEVKCWNLRSIYSDAMQFRQTWGEWCDTNMV